MYYIYSALIMYSSFIYVMYLLIFLYSNMSFSPSPCPSLSIFSAFGISIILNPFQRLRRSCGPKSANGYWSSGRCTKPGQYNVAIGSRWTVRLRPKTRGYKKAPCSAERIALFFSQVQTRDTAKRLSVRIFSPKYFTSTLHQKRTWENIKEWNRHSSSAPIRTTGF